MQHLDYFSLHLFILVCEEGTIGRASERAFIAPSAASKRISDIEQRFGTVLLKRSKRGVEPTSAGLALLRHARALTRAMERLDSELGEYVEGERGHVRLLANVSSITEFLPEELSTFMLKNPGVQVDMQERFSLEVTRGVLDGSADLGVCRRPAACGELHLLPYRQDHLAVVVGADHALASHTCVGFEETLAFDHIGLSSFATLNTFLRREAEQRGQALHYRSCMPSFHAALRLIQCGLGLALFPHEAVVRYAPLFDVRIIPLTEAWAVGEQVICLRDREALSPPAQRLLEHLLNGAACCAADAPLIHRDWR